MGIGDSMTFLESLTISGMGLSVVFMALAVLAMSITIFSNFFVIFKMRKDSKNNPAGKN